MAEAAILAALQALEQRQQQQAADMAAAIQQLAQTVQVNQQAQQQTQTDLATALQTINGFAANQQAQADALAQGLAQQQQQFAQTTAQAAQSAAQQAMAAMQQAQQPQQPATHAQAQPGGRGSPPPVGGNQGSGAREAKSLIDVKSVGRPTNFKGEEEKYQSWNNKTTFYFNGVYPGTRRLLKHIELLEGPIDMNDLGLHFPNLAEQLEEINEGLHTLLGCITEDDPQVILLNFEEGEGFEAWRRINRRYDPRTTARTRTMFAEIMKSPECKLDGLLAGIEALERKILTCEQRKKVVMDDDMKIGAILNMCPKNIRDHVDLNAANFTTYSQVRALVISYTENQVSNTAMDISAVGKGGKGSAGKGKGSGKGCYTCGALDHYSNQCSKKGQGKGKDGGKSKGGGKGDGGKGKGKGNAKGKDGQQAQKKCKHCAGTSREFSHWTSECRFPGGKAAKPVNSVDSSSSAAQSSGSTDPASMMAAFMKEVQTYMSHKKPALTVDAIGIKTIGSLDLGSLPGEGVQQRSSISAVVQVDEQVKAKVDKIDGYGVEKVRVGLDSGAATSVCPKSFAIDYPTIATAESEAGQEFRVANGQTIRNEGLVRPVVYTDSGGVRRLELTKTDVHKVLLAAGKMVRQGQIVHLEFGNCYVQDPETGEKLEVILEDDDTFSMEFNMVPAADLAAISAKVVQAVGHPSSVGGPRRGKSL